MNRPAKCQMWANVSAPQACPSAGSLRSPDTHGGRCPGPRGWQSARRPRRPAGSSGARKPPSPVQPHPPLTGRLLNVPLPRPCPSTSCWSPGCRPLLGEPGGRTGWASTCGQSLPCPPHPQPCCLDGTATPRCRGGGFPAHRQPCCPRGTATAWVSGRSLTRPQPLGLSSGLSQT